MGASSSRVQELEALLHSLQGANVQLERQLLTVSKESDATKRGEMVAEMQRETEKIRKENEQHRRQLTEELQRLRSVLPALEGNAGGDDVTQGSRSSPSSPLAREIDHLRARLEKESPALRVKQLEQELEAAQKALQAAQSERQELLAKVDQLRGEVEQVQQKLQVVEQHQQQSQEADQIIQAAKQDQAEAEAQWKKQVADLDSQLAAAISGFQAKEATFTQELQSLQADNRKSSAELAEQQELYLKQQKRLAELEEASQQTQLEAAKDRAERLKVGEWVLQQKKKLRVACQAPQCTASVTRKIAEAAAVLPAIAPGGASDHAPSDVCVTCESGGEGSVQHRATRFCARGHANQCDSCWEQDVHTKCAALMAGEGSAPGHDDDPVNALMLTFPPPVLVPECDSEPLADSSSSSAATSSSSSSKTISKKQEHDSFDIPSAATSSSSSSSSKKVASRKKRKDQAKRKDDKLPDEFSDFVSGASSSSSSSSVSISSNNAGKGKQVDHSQLTRRTCPSCDRSYRHDRQAFPDLVPRLLQCAHTLCSACASRDLKQARLAEQLALSCCVCREPTFLSEVAGEALPEAEAVLELIQQSGSQTSSGTTLCGECSEQEATVHCEQCADDGPVCEPCFVALHPARSKMKKDHKPVPFTERAVGLCRTHRKPLDLFCSNELCWSALCEDCRASHSSSVPQAITHKIESLSEFAAKYLEKLNEEQLLTEGRAGVDELERVLHAWLDESRQAQRLGRSTQQLTSQQVVKLVQLLHTKTRLHVQRGLIRRAAVGPLLSRFAVLHEAIKAAVNDVPVAMLRAMPSLLHQWAKIKDDPFKQQIDLSALNLKLLTSFLTAVPNHAAAMVAHLDELVAPPLAHETGSGNVSVFNCTDGSLVTEWATQEVKHASDLAVFSDVVYVVGHNSVPYPYAYNATDGSPMPNSTIARTRCNSMIFPHIISISGGFMCVADHKTVRLFNLDDGSFVREWQSWEEVSGVASSNGHVYILERKKHRVMVFKVADGSFVCGWGNEGSGDGQFLCPGGIAVADAQVYITDTKNHRVQVFNAIDGSFLRKWGSEGSGDGQLCFPTKIAVSGGLAYVIDHGGLQVFRC